MTSLDATQTDDFIRQQSKLILQMIFLLEYCCFVFIWFSNKHLNIFSVMLQSLQDAFLLLNVWTLKIDQRSHSFNPVIE